MTWYVISKVDTDNRSINIKLKGVIRESPFFRKLFDIYSVPMDKLDDLSFKIKKIKGRYAVSNANEIWLNEKLFEDGRFWEDRLHFVVHEMSHWLTRQREKEQYFADPEERISFVYSMLWEIERGKSKEEILEDFFPIMKAHFADKKDTLALFEIMFQKALSLKHENQWT